MRIKKNVSRFGTWPLLERDVIKFISDWPEEFTIGPSDLMPIFHAAIYPEKLAAKSAVGLRREFCRMYALRPDFVIYLLKSIRSVWNRADHAFLVKRFLLTTPGIVPLQDGEVAAAFKAAVGIAVSSATVKKARQSVAKGSEHSKDSL